MRIEGKGDERNRSVLNRPFDDQSQVKIFLETQAFLLILNLIESQKIALVSSSVLDYENSRNSRLERANAVNLWLSLSKTYQKLTPEIRLRAKALEEMGVWIVYMRRFGLLIRKKLEVAFTNGC